MALRKWFPLLAIVAIASLGFAACGDDEEATDEAPITQEAEDTIDEAEETVTGEETVEVTADPGGALSYEETSLTAQAGSTTFEMTNDSSLPHDVRIEDASGEDVGGTDVITQSADEATVDLEAGTYTFYCSVPGHREAGMEGELTVE